MLTIISSYADKPMINPKNYITRFAPTPSGDLHFGSLVAATASYLNCCANNGKWYLRIDDIDAVRATKKSADNIIFSLANLGFCWHKIYYQSQHQEHYQQALEKLTTHTFLCGCSRTTLVNCQCIKNPPAAGSLRLKTNQHKIVFIDELQGEQTQNLQNVCKNFVLKRADNIISYHLATVVDDHILGVTHIVRGYDLLGSTARQIFISNLLNNKNISYSHIPIVLNVQQQKLSKQTKATAIDNLKPSIALWHSFNFLNLNPPQNLQTAPIKTLWEWAKSHWKTQQLQNKKEQIYYF